MAAAHQAHYGLLKETWLHAEPGLHFEPSGDGASREPSLHCAATVAPGIPWLTLLLQLRHRGISASDRQNNCSKGLEVMGQHTDMGSERICNGSKGTPW